MAKAAALFEQPTSVTRVLLVEDNPSDAYLIGHLLGEQNGTRYDIHHVKTQGGAIQALGTQVFDVCLLDLTLPDASGFSALIDIQEKAPNMPALILTGLNDAGLAKRAVGRGAQDYLLKSELEAGTLARSIDYACERKRNEKELFRRANYDPLTGLANRSLFEARLKMALARSERLGTGIAVLFLDLDDFKPINDTYGHEAGDGVLKAVAARFKSVLRTYDTAARFGGDEFAVLLEGIHSPRDAASIAQKIIDVLIPGVPWRTRNIVVGVSIGIAFSEGGERAEALLLNADAAMYQVKEEGGNQYRFYETDIHRRAEARLRAEEELRLALAGDQLRLYYQPYVAPEAGAILGIEALLRWAHPERGILHPPEFLSLAGECRLMPEIGQWMFARLARDLALWNAQKLPPLEIAFNVCGAQLAQEDFLQWLAPLAAKETLGKHRLVAEVHSDALATLSQPLFLTFVKMREMGIDLHIDHFGQGPMSLQTLHTYPFSLIKLNLAAVEEMRGAHQEDAIIRTAIEIAHQLGMKAGAVGVETPSQMQMLQAQRCDLLQGFLIGHPMTAEQLPQWLTARG